VILDKFGEQISQLTDTTFEAPRQVSRPQLNWPIWVLATGLPIAGFGLTYLATGEPTVMAALFIATLYCQASLLGLWAGFGSLHFVWRLTTLFVAMAVLIAEITWIAGVPYCSMP
jgi:hypothetical protein